MTDIKWKSLAELIGISAIVASLIFVGLQIRQEQNVAVSQVFQSILEAEVEIHQAMAEHADVWLKARDPQSLSKSEVKVIVELTEMWSARAFFEVQAAMRIDDGNWSGPINVFAYMLYENPGVRQLWSDNLARKERAYRHLDQSKPFIQFNNQVRDRLKKTARLG